MLSRKTVIPDGTLNKYCKISAIPVTPPLRSLALDRNRLTPNEEIKHPKIITTTSM